MEPITAPDGTRWGLEADPEGCPTLTVMNPAGILWYVATYIPGEGLVLHGGIGDPLLPAGEKGVVAFRVDG